MFWNMLSFTNEHFHLEMSGPGGGPGEVQVDVLEPDPRPKSDIDSICTAAKTAQNQSFENHRTQMSSSFHLQMSHFDLKLSGPGLLPGSCRVRGKVDNGDTGDTERVGTPETDDICEKLYDGIVVMKPFGSSRGVSEPASLPSLLSLLSLLRDGGVLLVELQREELATSNGVEILELNDLLQE